MNEKWHEKQEHIAVLFQLHVLAAKHLPETEHNKGVLEMSRKALDYLLTEQRQAVINGETNVEQRQTDETRSGSGEQAAIVGNQ